MADKNYVYAVTRIRAKELSLLSEAFIGQLVHAESYAQCVQLLREKGWGSEESSELGALLRGEREKTWQLMRELLKEDISRLDVFLYANDYHNLKAAIKETLMNHEYEGIYIDQGSIPAERIRQAVAKQDFSLLPEAMRVAAREALDAFLQTGDGQLCDIIVDRQALTAMYEAGKRSGSAFLKLYAELTVAIADIKTALRAQRTGKDREFLQRALAPCDSLDIGSLANAALQGEEALHAYLERTAYADGLEALSRSLAAFEKWCDDLLIEKMLPQKRNPFGLDPLAAYVLARENELKTVRIILSAKQNHLPEQVIEERVRRMYA